MLQSFVGIVSLCGDLPLLEVWIVDLDAEPVVCFTGDVNHKWSNVGSVRQPLCMEGVCVCVCGTKKWEGREEHYGCEAHSHLGYYCGCEA